MILRGIQMTRYDIIQKWTDFLYYTSTSQYGVIDVKEFVNKR